MDAQWVKSPTARRILVHWGDPRPAWLWAGDGSRLIWRNEAARLFLGRVKKWGLKLAPDAVPIKGQIARLVRLGAVGRSSLSRIQFLAGDKAVSTTCACTPLRLADEDKALLIVGVDPIDPEVLALRGVPRTDNLSQSLFPRGADYLVIGGTGEVDGGSPHAIEHFAPAITAGGLPATGEDSTPVMLAGEEVTVTRYRASEHGAVLLLFERAEAEPAETIEAVREEEGLDEEAHAASGSQPLLPLGLAPVPAADEPSAPVEEGWVVQPAEAEPMHRLTSLFDRLAEDEDLYSPLSEADDQFIGQPAATVAQGQPTAAPADEQAEAVARDAIAELIEAEELERAVAVEPPAPTAEAIAPPAADDAEAPEPVAPAATLEPPATTWRVIGRGFVADVKEAAETAGSAEASEDVPAPEPIPEAPAAGPELPPAQTEAPAAVPGTPETPDIAEAEVVARRELDRTSRYNFDELGRILTDRIGVGVGQPQPPQPSPSHRQATTPARNEGTLINLAGETFILNRLPLGILVFRDQQVMFANRALTDLTGHDSIDSLRTAGLTSIFPAEDAASVGPVTHLVRRDGLLLPVNARLQSISWHGQPALMLSASLAENRPVHEIAVKTFAELVAELHEEGFFTADRGGMVSQVSLHGRILMGRDETELAGQPLSALIEPAAHEELKSFLDRPARFAETARPGIVFAAAVPDIELTLFAEGQAGIVSGYFGFVRRREHAVPAPRGDDTVDTEMLGRFSRSVRRPLNTVIGFADLIRSTAFGPIDIPRYLEYAGDILEAGQEIAGLINEIDDLTQLSGGTYAVQSDALDLTALLDGCVMRVRAQAAARRVLVRSAVSERLPHVRADRASLTQAILNLLASAIDQSPAGGTVILSAQPNDEGGMTINLRDSAAMKGDSDERFVVFREAGAGNGSPATVHSSVGLALTRSLLKVNALTLSIDPVIGVGTLFSLTIPAELAVRDQA